MTSKKRIIGRRPAYRESREDRSVKVAIPYCFEKELCLFFQVYTINHESRYILVKEVPKISNIKDEVLKLFSLYGTIQEYRILDSHPDAEEFSTVFWIKYTHIQSARVAKRKMNNHSFYGVFLKVTYGPEYEDVDDTRQKLIERRKAVARRLRQLETTKQEGKQQQANQLESTSEAQTIQDTEDRNPQSEDTNYSNIQSLHPAERGSSSHENSQSLWQKFPALPPPPSHLPPTEWSNPTSEPDETIPHVPSAHATLPKGFDPFSEGGDSSRTSATSSFPQNGDKVEMQRGTAHHSAMHSSEVSINFSRSKTQNSEVPSTSPWSYVGKKEVTLASSDPQLKQNIRGGARPKLIPRKRFAWNNKKSPTNTDTNNRFLGQRLNPPPLPACNPSFIREGDKDSRKDEVTLQRQGLKRRATTSLEEEGPSTASGSAAAEIGATSFDQSVLNIREKMIQISQVTHQHQPQSSSLTIPQQGPTQTTQVSSMPDQSRHGPNSGASPAGVSGSNNDVSSTGASQPVSVIASADSQQPSSGMPTGLSRPQSRRGPSSTKRRRI
ncbi:RNA-binding protein 48 [Holothuria leucospilota]|uniref:RNA-binding protein 48 n=1 Tax=Holothuria leucospilota TaxID=206669 RepID=A0A9Q1BH29_HOLLE|nr:RNA-binding protein 48 [Holothuria leucospilota]